MTADHYSMMGSVAALIAQTLRSLRLRSGTAIQESRA